MQMDCLSTQPNFIKGLFIHHQFETLLAMYHSWLNIEARMLVLDLTLPCRVSQINILANISSSRKLSQLRRTIMMTLSLIASLAIWLSYIFIHFLDLNCQLNLASLDHYLDFQYFHLQNGMC